MQLRNWPKLELLERQRLQGIFKQFDFTDLIDALEVTRNFSRWQDWPSAAMLRSQIAMRVVQHQIRITSTLQGTFVCSLQPRTSGADGGGGAIQVATPAV